MSLKAKLSGESVHDVVASVYTPRELQAVIHADGHRFRLAVCHRRFGKTFLCVAEVLRRALDLDRRNMELSPPRFAFIAPTNDGAKSLGFDIMKKFLGEKQFEERNSPPYTLKFESEARPDITITVEFFGAQQIDNYRGRHLDGVVVDEYAEMPGMAWKAAILPMLSDYKGFGLVIGTPKGRNQFYDLYQEAKEKPDFWGVHYYPASQTEYVDKSELEIQKEQLGEDWYNQEFELQWNAVVVGAYYGALLNEAERDGRIAKVPYDPDYPVHTGWDLGIHDATAVWFAQNVHGEIRVIDWFEVHEQSLEQVIQESIIERKDSSGRRYKYGRHYFPHDLAQRDNWQGRSRETLVQKELKGNGIVQIVQRRKIEDGIAMVRRLIPRMAFDQRACARGLDLLTLYRCKYDETMKVATTPMRNQAVHTADALRSLCMGMGFASDRKAKPGEEEEDTLYDPTMSMKDLVRKHGKPCPYYPRGHDAR